MNSDDEYTFVTLDDTYDNTTGDNAVVIDMDSDMDLSDAITIDDNMDDADFITMTDSNDQIITDNDTIDMNMDDVSIDGSDISIII